MTDENKSAATPNSPPPADPSTDPVNRPATEIGSPTPPVTSSTQNRTGNTETTNISPSPSPGVPETVPNFQDNVITREPTSINANEHPSDPQVADLKAIFPDFDDAILQSVLASVGGNQDQAIDTLLGMSDPNYKSESRLPQQRVLSQEALDEQFARSLYMQEQDEHQRYQQARWEAQQQRPTAPGRRPSQNAGGGDMMADVQEQFKYIAETGRKTFGNIMSKVKAKISEFDQQRQGQSSATYSTYGDAGGDTHPYDSVQSPNPNQQYQAYRPHQPPSTAQQPAFYDPNPQSSSPTSHTSPQGFTTNANANATNTVSEAQGYDVSSSPPDSSITTPRPPATGSGSGIDGGKLGLLPKRPVSLLAQSPPPGDNANKTERPDDDDELEYVENPFEEGSGRK
ncbi:cue domain-containing protein [Moniliophthora roreri MCA 2997]|uniref:Cue domain-containing protein n=2 Tax=Moniliophthora roreri TaxID=221103 RepID=V2X3M8_MONRO|nr:cue domain-containing protein [Moniliophthora roreri MCA 2997]KAI3610451.1 cue domain-containing protein [Moniliophthora roreri]